MMGQQHIRKLIEACRPCCKSKKNEKVILDELVAATQYHCKYTIRLLKQGASGKRCRKMEHDLDIYRS
jgi:hypothetical protein